MAASFMERQQGIQGNKETAVDGRTGPELQRPFGNRSVAFVLLSHKAEQRTHARGFTTQQGALGSKNGIAAEI
jgi:hypothetical protein